MAIIHTDRTMQHVAGLSARSDSRRMDLRSGLLCAAVVVGAVFLINPWAEMPFNDDFSYAFMVREFLRSGRIIYTGWGAPAMITQVYWGALFARIFGFSFSVLRLSTLPLAAGCAGLFYLVSRRAGLRPGWAVFSALLLSLSPLFLPLATSFMTDVPALFCILLVIYASDRAAQGRGSARWLAVAVAVGVVGGMTRQVVWIVPLITLLYVACRSGQRRMMIASAIGWIVIVLDGVLTVRWLDHQPNMRIETFGLPGIMAALRHLPVTMNWLLRSYLALVLLTLPAGIPFFAIRVRHHWRNRSGRAGLMLVLAIAALVIGVFSLGNDVMDPGTFDLITIRGVLGSLELSGNRPATAPAAALAVLSGVSLILGVLPLALVGEWVSKPRRAVLDARRFFLAPDGRVILPMLCFFSIAYIALLVTRMPFGMFFDRYLLPLMICFALPMLVFAQRRTATEGAPGRAVAWTLLAIFALYAVASTQDVLALARARAAGIARFAAAGVQPTAIAAGMEYDLWTQISAQGYVNIFGISNPTNPFKPGRGLAPSLFCAYRLEFGRQYDTVPSKFGSIDYVSWLPPFRRRIDVDAFFHPLWLDSPRVAPPRFWETYDLQ